MNDANAATEAEIRRACEARDFPLAATLALEAYGPQILSFLTARLRSATDAEEVFSVFAEDMWNGLPGFGFRCSARGWLYALARTAASRHLRAPARRADRNLHLSHEAVLGALVGRLRSSTQAYQRTDVKDVFRGLREELPEEDQALLILYIDKKLPWREIAIVMNEQNELPDDSTLEREAARLRKRFERVKVQLKELAIKKGLLAR